MPVRKPAKYAPAIAVHQWIQRTGGWSGPMSLEAFTLLGARLAVRRRANRVMSILGFAEGALLVLNFGPGLHDATSARHVALFGALVASLALSPVLYEVLVVRGDRRVSAALARRVSAGVRLSVAQLLGPWRLVGIGLTLLGNVAVLVLLVDADARAGLVSLYSGAVAVCLIGTALTIRRLSRRPTVATDDDSLALDHRVRLQDGRFAATPLCSLSYAVVVVAHAFQGADSRLAWLVPVALLAPLPASLVESVIGRGGVGRKPRWTGTPQIQAPV